MYDMILTMQIYYLSINTRILSLGTKQDLIGITPGPYFLFWNFYISKLSKQTSITFLIKRSYFERHLGGSGV